LKEVELSKKISEKEPERNELMGRLSESERRRLKKIQELIAEKDQAGYGKRQEAVAKKLGISVRSVRRLIRRIKEEGNKSVIRQVRSDKGKTQINEEWERFIVKTYQEGNRGSTQMSPAQVAVRVKVRAQEKGIEKYPSRMTVYRILKPLRLQGQKQKRGLGWREDSLIIKTKEGREIPIEWSNQVWQCDHTMVDVLLVDRSGEMLGRPWLTTVVDTYSRCIMGMHLGFDTPSAAVVCLALRHAILPKKYSSSYEVKQNWGTYGIPQYLYTDGAKDFRSQHLEQVANELGIVLCLRRKPSDGGIVERPFGTLNSQFFCTCPGYVSNKVGTRSKKAETEACMTLVEMERLLVRYVVDHYNQAIDARMSNQSRIGRWDAGRIAQLKLMGDRDLDVCLMRKERRIVYRSGYIQFASLTYQGEHLAAYAGESVVIRYNPRDITTVLVYQIKNSKEVFVTRAHAQGWETETLSYREAQAISKRRRKAGKAIDNRSMLEEVRDRDEAIKTLKRQKKKKQGEEIVTAETEVVSCVEEAIAEVKIEEVEQKKPLEYVIVRDYEEMLMERGLL
jgi:putative transposase